MNNTAAVFRTIMDKENPYDEIWLMNRYELKSYIREHRSIQKVIMKGRYSEEDRLLSSKVIYTKNRLRLM